jgi:hypothetical protein
MAQAKRKTTTKPSRLPARQTPAQLYKGAIGRMEQIITTLATRVVAEGWHESWESGPMPKRAAEVMAYLRARAAGKRENAAQDAAMVAFISDCGQSVDWIFDGDVGGMICRAAGAKVEKAQMVPREKVQEIAHEIFELETPVLDARNLALATRMLASSDDMSKEAGRALDSVADALFNRLEGLSEAQHRIWLLAKAAA